MTSSPISNCRHSKSSIFISCNINYNINSLLLLRVGTYIYIYIYIYLYINNISVERYIPKVEMFMFKQLFGNKLKLVILCNQRNMRKISKNT